MDRALAITKGNRWFVVSACEIHVEGLTGLRR
jgi:hypothetical protein